MSSNLLTTRNIDFFNFDAMTWDAVAELPRDVPLILPLGSGYDLDLLADQLGSPPPRYRPVGPRHGRKRPRRGPQRWP